MKRLILTSSSGLGLIRAGLDAFVIPIMFRFVWGALPSPNLLADYLAARADQGPGDHWSDYADWRGVHEKRSDLRLMEFCQSYEAIELWFDRTPNDQLQLVWLLDCFRSEPELTAKMIFRQIDFDLIGTDPQDFGKLEVLPFAITEREFSTGSKAWNAYRSATPQACFDLLHADLSALLMLKPALLWLCEELPSRVTALGATEMRMLEMLARGYETTNALFHLNGRKVFGEFEVGSLLDGLALGPKPAVAGLDDELRSLHQENYRGRLEAYHRSRLSLTEFGKSVLAGKEDFSRHNPIDRWWGGTHLTNDNLWRCGFVLTGPYESRP